MSDLAGQRLGQYQIISVLGQGGMATVYKATQASMNREVAVKVITGQMADNPDFIARFEREVRLIAQLQHPHILPVYDYGQEGKLIFLVMRLVEGGSLDHRLRHRPLEVRQAARMITQIASALNYAHDQGIIHRDLKPNNILLDKKDNPYLMDFGIAKMVEGQTRLTATGMVMGTPAYMAPEQWRAETLDLRTDIYALGIMLYEMLTGELPFTGDTPYALMYQHLDAPRPSPVTRRPDIPEGVSNAIQRAMAKDKEDRYSSADAFAEDVNAALAGLPVSGPQAAAPADPHMQTMAEGLETPAGPTASPVRTVERQDRTIPEGVDSAAQHAAPTRPGAQPQHVDTYMTPDIESRGAPNRIPQIATVVVALLLIAALAAFVLPRLSTPPSTPTSAAVLPSSTASSGSTSVVIGAATGAATDQPTQAATATTAPTERPTEKASDTPQPTQTASQTATQRATEASTPVVVAAQATVPTAASASTEKPTEKPTDQPTASSSNKPTDKPTEKPTDTPATRPTTKPSDTPIPIIVEATVTPAPTSAPIQATAQATGAATAASGTAVAGTSLLIFRADDTLTLYIASKGFVALDGLTIESENTQGQRLTYRLDRSPSFIGLPFTHLPSPTCFQLQSRTRQAPIPIECRQIPPTQLFIEKLTPANMIWYDSTVGEARQVFITRNSQLLGVCPVTLAQCEIVIPNA